MNSPSAHNLATDPAPKTEPPPVGRVTPLLRVPPLTLGAASGPVSDPPSYSPPPDFQTSDVDLFHDAPFMPHCGCCTEAQWRITVIEPQLALANQQEVSGNFLVNPIPGGF